MILDATISDGWIDFHDAPGDNVRSPPSPRSDFCSFDWLVRAACMDTPDLQTTLADQRACLHFTAHSLDFLDLGQLISFLISSLSVCLSLACGLTRSISLLSSLLHQHLHPSQYVCIDAPTFTFHHAPCAPHPLRFYSATRLAGVTVVLTRHTSSLVCRSCILCTFLLRPPHPTHHITHTLRSLE